MGDILNQDLAPNEQGKKVIDPSQSQLVKVLSSNDESALCITYSPLGAGEFKFWDVRPLGDGHLQVSDLYPNNTLVPQAPTSEIWTLADFSVVKDESMPTTMALWALWKNNVTYRLLKVEFSRNSTASVARDIWDGTWMSMATETLRESPMPAALPGDPSDSTDKWLEFILCPGRFTTATLETGVAIYGNRRGAAKEISRRNTSLLDRMCATVASTASLDRDADGGMNYEQFRRTTNEHWSTFYRLLLELDKRRGEALSLVVDPQGQMPWVVLADGITAIRDCSRLEQIWHNNKQENPATEHVARPLAAAAAFRDSFSDNFLHNCKAMLLDDIFQEPSLTTPARMRAFYDKCDFANQVGDEEYSRLVTDLKHGFKILTPQVYRALLELMSSSEDFDKRQQVLPLAEFGNKLVVKGVQETVELHRNVCFDQLVLLVLLEVEINHGEEGIQFETALVYDHLIQMLKRLELLHWLASTQISLPIKKLERSNSVTDKTSSLVKKSTPSMETITVLEGVLRHLFSLDLRPYELMSSVITEVIIQICAPDSEYEAPTSVIQCFLLKHDRADLAMEFCRFAGHDAFAIYVQGRANLAANDAATAASLFKKAAFGLGKRFSPSSRNFVTDFM
jgi:nuclear pore complex protein Nup160